MRCLYSAHGCVVDAPRERNLTTDYAQAPEVIPNLLMDRRLARISQGPGTGEGEGSVGRPPPDAMRFVSQPRVYRRPSDATTRGLKLSTTLFLSCHSLGLRSRRAVMVSNVVCN